MISNSQTQRMFSFSELPVQKSAWGVFFSLVLLEVFLITPAQAATFTVNSPLDVSDANPGNGVCETATGNGICTLRAAIQETNALPGADTIVLPPNSYVLTISSELVYRFIRIYLITRTELRTFSNDGLLAPG
jgi:CSLREA domain-containing protein